MSSEIEFLIEKSLNSRIHPLKKDELAFGKEFTDHMLICDYENGEWQTPKIIPYGNFIMAPATSCLHYGQAIFEGIKGYRHNNGKIAIFRPNQNFHRMNRSARRMDMPEVPEAIFMEGMRKLVELDANWVPGGDDTSLYIRPFMVAMDEFIGVRTALKYRFAIICSPAGPYYGEPVNIYVQDKYVRAVKGGTGFAKAAGNYGATMLPASEVKKMGYDQVLWTDPVEHKYVQEIGTMNVFFVVDGKAITPDLSSGTILSGVTRRSIIQLFKDNDITVEERPILIEELEENFDKGMLEEAFGAGTAASMSPIASLTYKGQKMQLPPVENWKISSKIKKELDDIRYGRIEDRHKWLFYIN